MVSVGAGRRERKGRNGLPLVGTAGRRPPIYYSLTRRQPH